MTAIRLDPVHAGWGDTALAAQLVAIDPAALGGLWIRSGPEPQRDVLSGWVDALLPDDAPRLRVPTHITEDRLLGGVALAETLRTGRLVTERGILGRAHGGLLTLPMAERLEPFVVSAIASALDRRAIAVEREGLAMVVPARLGIIALDEGLDDEGLAPALADRLAFRIDLRDPRLRSIPDARLDPAPIVARARCGRQSATTRSRRSARRVGARHHRASGAGSRGRRGAGARGAARPRRGDRPGPLGGRAAGARPARDPCADRGAAAGGGRVAAGRRAAG